MLRWSDPDHTGADHGLGIDDFSVTPQGTGGNAPVVPTCPATLTTTQGTPTSGPISATDADGTVVSATITGITPVNPGTITITGFTPAGGVGGTANGTLSVSNTTPVGSYSVTIQWANNDAVPQTADCVVAVTVNPPPVALFIHDVQGNGSSTPIPPATPVTVEGVVIGRFQATGQLAGFFLQEEDADADADPQTSEGIFIFCGGCPTAVAEGQRVQVTGPASEFFGMTELTATTAGSVVVTNAGNNLAQVTPAPIDLPVAGDVNAFYERLEGMRVTFVDSLSVSEYFEQARFGTLELFEGGRPLQFTETTAPSVPGYAAHLDNLTRRRVLLDDDNDNQNGSLLPFQPEGSQFNYFPRANGGLSVGTQGIDFFRGGDLVNAPDRRPALVVLRTVGDRRLAHPARGRDAGGVHGVQPAAALASRGRRRHQGREHEPAQLLHHDRHHLGQLGPLRAERDAGLPRGRQRGRAEPAARAHRPASSAA